MPRARGGGGGTAPGTRHTLDHKYTFGTPEEIANRDKTTYQPDPPAFAQIPFGQGAGTGSFNDLGATTRHSGGSGLKFSRDI
jgi:hypothetical protein